LVIAGGLLLLYFTAAPPSVVSADQAQGISAGAMDVISQINSYRAQNGLPAYRVHQDLMTIAQAQSDHQAAIGSVTHTGPGGTSPRQRAHAIGYGGGGTIWISEIIYGGSQATSATAMSWWKGSQVHNQAMLSSRYQEIGAGVASSGSQVYFTAVMAVVAGGASGEDGGSSNGSPAGNSPPANPAVPVVMSDPQPDGSIVHEVQTGQTLWSISAVYEVPLETLISQNDLSKHDVIYPGQELLIRPPHTPEPTDEHSESMTEQTDRPETPLASPTPRALADRLEGVGANAPEAVPEALPERPGGQGGSVGAVAIGLLALYAVIMILALSLRGGDESDPSAS
jgi:LysM repeat protein